MNGGQIEAVPSRCGCAGKTPLERVVRPALASLRAEHSLTIAGDVEAGLLPNTAGIERSVADDDGGAGRFVAAAFVDPERGSDAEAFRGLLASAYRRWGGRAGGSTTVIKGHSIQLGPGAKSAVWGERLRPTGERRPGYRVANVDVIHALPGIDPVTQAGVASAHALNDCYTQGAAGDRRLRPIVGVPDATAVDPDRVRRWYREAAASDIAVSEPSVVAHGGRGWQFGASVLAVTTRTPPVETGAIEAGDEVLLHRPPGALALLAGRAGGDGPIDGTTADRAIEALAADHAPVARAIAASSPPPDGAFDPARHLKWAGDISGPGIGGLLGTVESAGCGLSFDALSLFDREGLDAVRERWIVPDVTVETNGPIAAIGTPSALDRFERRLSGCPSADPTGVGTVTDRTGILRWDAETNAERYIETGQ